MPSLKHLQQKRASNEGDTVAETGQSELARLPVTPLFPGRFKGPFTERTGVTVEGPGPVKTATFNCAAQINIGIGNIGIEADEYLAFDDRANQIARAFLRANLLLSAGFL